MRQSLQSLVYQSGFLSLIGFFFKKEHLEENELKNHGIERIGIIQNYKYRKEGG